MPSSVHPVSFSANEKTVQVSVAYSGIIEFLELFSETSYYLNIEEYADDTQLSEIKAFSEEITRNCSNTYDKIHAIMVYVSDSVHYDYQYLEGVQFRSQQPYEVFKTNIAVCQGYSDLATVMLRSIGVPCMTATSHTHAYNFAHDGQRWIFFDPTWCSENKFTVNGEMLYDGYNDNYFDLTSDEIFALGISHQTAQIICGPATAYLDWTNYTAQICPTEKRLST